MKLFEMFAGYGGGSFALKKVGIDFQCVGFSEIDKFAIQCYEQNHRGKNYGDCSEINPIDLPDFDLLTGGFPCQSFSVAGKGLGEQDIRGTLFYDIIRIAETKKPKYILLENVKGLTNKRHAVTLQKILSELKRIGYYVHVQVLNSKEHGIPQNRERVFFVCFKDKVDFDMFIFPGKEKLKIFLKDILEDEVDEKYYLKDEQTEKLLTPKVAYCIDANYSKGTNLKQYFLTRKKRQIVQVNNPKHSNNRVYLDEGISPILNAMQGGNRQPFIIASRGRYTLRPGLKTEQKLEPRFDGASNTITSVQKDNYVGLIDDTQGFGDVRKYRDISPILRSQRSGLKIIQRPRGFNKGGVKELCPTISSNYWEQNNFLFNDFRIRKLTPTECFRLMGFLNDGINLKGISNSQRYKLAGNGWDVNLVSKIFKEMFR